MIHGVDVLHIISWIDIKWIDGRLIWFFTNIPQIGENLAFFLFLAFIVAALLLILFNWSRYHQPMMAALRHRLKTLNDVMNAEDPSDNQQAFSRDFGRVDEAMRRRGRQTHDLRRAWSEYKETIVDPNIMPLHNTARPADFFLHLSDGARALNWWANIFVALGLTITFLGIIAALASATRALGTNADPAMMQASLVTLLAVTAAKFWTSIGGVLGSIILRFVDRVWKVRIERRLARLADKIELGMQYLPPQRIAADQLTEAREQTAATKTLTTELAAAIRENFTTAIQPMTDHLGRIHSSMEEFKTGGFNQIGRELGDALSRNAGKEMEGLARSLTDMTERLATIPHMLAGSGEAASRQIETAAREFAVASENMNRVFDQFSTRVEEMGGRIASQAEEAANKTAAQFDGIRQVYQNAAEENRTLLAGVTDNLRASSSEMSRDMVAAVRQAVTSSVAESNDVVREHLARFAATAETIGGAFDALHSRIGQAADVLTTNADKAATRNAEVLERAAAALEATTLRASASMGEAVDEAVRRASDASGRAVSTAFQTFAERFDEASGSLVEMLRTMAERLDSASHSIERSTHATGEHAAHLERAGAEVQSMAVVFGRAANDVQAATAPIREATASINASLSDTRDIMAAQSASAEANQIAIERVSSRLAETFEAATQAWSEYRARFAEVDRALGEALEKIANASSEHAGHLNAHVGKIDMALGEAVGKLHDSLAPLNELAESVEDVLGRLPQVA
jgi:hypothetical protein